MVFKVHLLLTLYCVILIVLPSISFGLFGLDFDFQFKINKVKLKQGN